MDEPTFARTFAGLRQHAIDAAAERGTTVIEAEHLLLALTVDPRGTASKVLAASGLTHQGIESALDAERSHSLAVAGITTDPARLAAATPHRSRPIWGASVRDVLRTVHDVPARDRRKRRPEIDMLLGILKPDLGTVPRALSLAGIDRDALVDSVRDRALRE